MYKTAIHIKRILLFFGDILALQAALALTLLLRYGSLNAQTWQLHQFPFLIISALWAVGLFVTGLYDLSKARNTLVYFRTFLEGMFVNLLIAFAFFYLIPIFGIEPRANLFLFFANALLLIYAWRILFNHIAGKSVFKNRILYIGPTEEAIALRDLIKKSNLGFELATIIHTTPRTTHLADGIQWIDHVPDLGQRIEQDRINTVALGISVDKVPQLQEALYQSLYTSVAITDRKDIEETLTGKITLTEISKSWFLQHLRESEKTWFETVKRGADVITAIPFAVLTAVLFPFIAILIKATSKGTVLYSQERIGKHGKRFRMWKFRTMKQDAETTGAQFATKNDPRITQIGKFLRATRIDELPQIWNVLKGDMSFVGPRPERPEFVGQLIEQMPYYALRHLTRPGLTGWAQVRYRYAASLEDNLVKLQYDLYYVKHRSLLLDLAILLKTINTVLRQQGT